MRVLLDANLLISYLLTVGRPNAPTIIVNAAANMVFTVLLADEVLAEVWRKIATKRYLADRFKPSDIDRLWSALSLAGEAPPALRGPIPERGRDRNDDYLLARADQGRADYLVTRDKDLLDLAPEVLPLRIVSPGTFLRVAGLV